jgi:hypothetical protein
MLIVMKTKILLTCFALACVLSASAQNFKKFRVGVGLGYAKPSGSGSQGGVLAYIEPSYRLSDAISIGLRLESAIVARGLSGSDVDIESFNLSGLSSYTVNMQYYLSAKNFRPFVGLGFGLYGLSAMKTDVAFEGVDVTGQTATYTESVTLGEAQTKFGLYPRIGFDVGHFTLSFDYNLIAKSKFSLPGSEAKLSNSYFGIRVGANFGGGRK